MAPRNSRLRDASVDAAVDLGKALRRTAAPVSSSSASFQAARHAPRVYHVESARDTARVLFISPETELLSQVQQTLDGYLDLAELFAEVHILILRRGIPPKYPTLRISDSLWLYTASARHWWQLPQAGARLLERELAFAGGFRPDLIVARDPYESALVALRLARQYDRPAQLHLKRHPHRSPAIPLLPGFTRWHRYLARYTIPRFSSVRTDSDALTQALATRYVIPDLATLPQYQQYEALFTAKDSPPAHDATAPFTVSLLYVGSDFSAGEWYRALDAARYVLQQPQIGLYVLGPPSAATPVRERAALLGIKRQVRFVPLLHDDTLLTHLQIADLILILDTDAASEHVCLQAAAARVPIIATRTPARDETFPDGVAALLVPAADTEAIRGGIDQLLNNSGLRAAFARAAQAVMRTRFHSERMAYREAYRTSIEAALFVGDEEGSAVRTDPAVEAERVV